MPLGIESGLLDPLARFHGGMQDEVRPDREAVELPLEERAHGVGWRADDRLLVHVEAGVDQAGDAR